MDCEVKVEADRILEELFTSDNLDIVKTSLVHLAENDLFWNEKWVPFFSTTDWTDFLSTEFMSLERVTWVDDNISYHASNSSHTSQRREGSKFAGLAFEKGMMSKNPISKTSKSVAQEPTRRRLDSAV
jgi:hypothetical protein